MGPLIPLFWTSGDISSGFQKPEWAVLFALDRNIRDVCSLIFISGATPADLWAARTTTGRFLPSATKLRRLCFYRCLSVHRGVVSQHALQEGGAISACIAGGIPACLATGLQGGAWSRRGLLWGGLLQGVPAPTGGGGGWRPSRKQTATVADGTHPTGMHSCLHMRLVYKNKRLSQHCFC